MFDDEQRAGWSHVQADRQWRRRCLHESLNMMDSINGKKAVEMARKRSLNLNVKHYPIHHPRMLSPTCLPAPSYGPLAAVSQRNCFIETKSKLGAAGQMMLKNSENTLQPISTPIRATVHTTLPALEDQDLAAALDVKVCTPRSKNEYDEITYYSKRSKSTFQAGPTSIRSGITTTTTRKQLAYV